MKNPLPNCLTVKRSASSTNGTSWIATVSTTTRSCSTLLCLMLCSSAEGTPAAVEDMNTAVPGTRAALECALLANTSNGIEPSVMFWRISARPFDHVVSRVKIISPITSGTQPPSGILVKFAER